MAEATTGAASVNGTPLSPHGSTNPPTSAVVGHDGVGVHTQGTPMTTDTARMVEADFIKDPVDRVIVKQYMTGVPIDQICRHLPTIKRNGMRYEFYSVDEKKFASTVTDAVTAASGVVTMKVADGIFSIGDEILVKKVKAYADNQRTAGDSPKCGAPLRVLVVGYNNNVKKQLQVVAINGKAGSSARETLVPAIPANSEIYAIAGAYDETAMQGNIFSALPTKKERFMQIFKTQISWSTITKESDKEVDWTQSEEADMALRNLRSQIERAYIFGTQGYTYDNTANKERYIYTCGGILEQMLEGSHLLPYETSSLTGTNGEDFLVKDLVHPIFLENSGSAKRYMFAGSSLVANIATLKNVQKQMNVMTVERKFGYDWKVIQFMSWTLDLVQHPLLDLMGMKNCAFVLDLTYVQKAVMRSLSKDILDLRKSGIADVDSTVWTEISSICLKYPETHALIYLPEEWNPGASWSTGSSSSSSAA